MSQPAYDSAWAVCRDGWLVVSSVSRVRSDAISAFMVITDGPQWTENQWRKWKRKGYRASHVSINEHLFGKEQDQ